MTDDDQAFFSPARRKRARAGAAAMSQRSDFNGEASTPSTSTAASALAFTTGRPAADASFQEDCSMNAIPQFDPAKLAKAAAWPAHPAVAEAAKTTAKTLEVVMQSVVAGVQGLEGARADWVADSVKVLQLQATSAAAMAKAASVKEVLELQQQFAAQTLAAHAASVQRLGTLFALWEPILKPLHVRCSEIASAARSI